MFLFRLIFSPVKIVLFVARIVGYNRVLVFLIGVGVGLLIAPMTGAELRAQLSERIEERRRAADYGTDPAAASSFTTGV